MLKPTELQYVAKVLESPLIWQESRLRAEMFQDVLAKVLLTEIGKSLSKVGTFIPAVHLKKLFEDKSRLEGFATIGYPADLSSIESLFGFLERYETHDPKVTIRGLEDGIRDDFLKRKLAALFANGTEALVDSQQSMNEILRKISTSVDRLLYDDNDSVERYSTDELVAKELEYQRSGDVQKFEPSGIAIIDEVAGGVPVPSMNVIVATGKTGRV
jgi:hypothetical protein